MPFPAADVVVLDFDGTIMDSMDIKTEAYGDLYSAYGDEASQYAMDYHVRNGGLSRFEKFKHLHWRFEGRPPTDDECSRMDATFRESVVERILQAEFIPGAKEFIATHAASSPLYINSGAPEPELRDIVARLGLADCFRGVYGAPALKDEILRRIITEEKTTPQRVVMVGDSSTDLQAAEDTGTKFIGVGDFPPHISLPDLRGLAAALNGNRHE